MINLKDAYSNKTVLVTGHTGFKGSWLSIWLNSLGAKVIGYALEPEDEKCNYVLSNLKERMIDIKGDINDLNHLKEVILKYEPDYIFHLAAQPLVLRSYKEPIYTFETNVIGTINVLECMRYLEKKCVGIMITTDKVYENNEEGRAFKEDDKLGGYDPYSASKAATEIAINSYRLSFMNPLDYDLHQKVICSVRAGNVIGGGDFSQDRIIPDFIKANENNEIMLIRNPKSIRPWEFVLEPLYGYLLLGYRCYENPKEYVGAYNFGPDQETIRSVEELISEARLYFEDIKVEIKENENAYHEANLLLLDASKAKRKLNWKPSYNFEETVKATMKWYKEYKNKDVYDLCLEQINDYSKRL